MLNKIFMGVLGQKRHEDPTAGARIGGKELVQRLLEALKEERGVHIESLLTCLGALAGYACQMTPRAALIEAQGIPEDKVFMIMTSKAGERFFFGDALNKPLVEDKYSVWALAGGQAQHLGCAQLIDIQEIFAYVASTVGSDTFGIPRVPEQHRSRFLPIDYVKVVWPAMFPIVEEFCGEPVYWPLLHGFAIQEVMEMGKSVIDPGLALTIAMESAVPMSKIDMPELVRSTMAARGGKAVSNATEGKT